MEKRQVLGAIAAPCITVGGAAAIASFNTSVSESLRPLLMLAGGLGMLVGLAALVALLLTAKSKTQIQEPLRYGRGGDATVTGDGVAKGGRGGAIGGGDGGSAYVGGDGVALGGEAGQADRGGRSPIEANGGPNVQLPNGTWLWDYGRGGDPAVRLVLRPNVEVSEAVAYAFFRQWGRTFDDASRRTSASVEDVLALVNKRIAEGELTLWGRSSMDTRILSSADIGGGLDRPSLLAGQGQTVARLGEFDELLMNKQQVELYWPRYFIEGESISGPGIDAFINWRPTM